VDDVELGMFPFHSKEVRYQPNLSLDWWTCSSSDADYEWVLKGVFRFSASGHEGFGVTPNRHIDGRSA
jgi:hypothetical protein